MYKLIAVIFLCALSLNIYAQGHNSNTNKDEQNAFSLKGANATLIISNHTSDTLVIKGFLPVYLPISEEIVDEVIAPGKDRSIKVKMNYADFVQLTWPSLKLYCVPGKTSKCIIDNIKPLKVSFAGELAAENQYYLSYFKVAQTNQDYYKVGNQIETFDRFPALADSINKININFLNNYDQHLSGSFKRWEHQRLLYNNAFLKHHVLFDKAFKLGRNIKVSYNYFVFDRQVPLVGKNVPVSSEYLWYAVFRLRDQVVDHIRDESLLSAEMISAVTDLYGGSNLGDIVKMRLLYDVRAKNEERYVKLLETVNFKNPENRIILDSVSAARFSLPYIGKAAPSFKLLHIEGDSVNLSQYKGKLIIINFWASWCAPCIKEFSYENKLYEKFKTTKKLVIINICLDTAIDQWRQLSQQHKLAMVNLFANERQSADLKRKYNVTSFPKSIFIGYDLKVKHNSFKRANQISLSDLMDGRLN